MQYHMFSSGSNPVFYVHSIGYGTGKDATHFGPGCQSAYIVHYVTEGKGYFCGTEVVAGQGFLICPEDVVHYFPDDENPWEYVWFVSREPVMNELFSVYHAHPKTRVFHYDYVREVQSLAEEIVRSNKTYLPSLILTEHFLHVYNRHTASNPQKNNAETYMGFFTSYVENNVQSPLQIGKITELLGVSQQYLYQICKEHCGVSPKRYITERKLFYAKKMLQETNMTITEVATSTGFDDVLAFSKFFSKHTGKSPTEYRKK